MSGDYVLFLDHDDLLRKHSLLKFVEAIEGNPAAKLIYSDEDKINLFGDRVSLTSSRIGIQIFYSVKITYATYVA